MPADLDAIKGKVPTQRSPLEQFLRLSSAFDIIGAIAVTGWVVLVGAYIYELNVDRHGGATKEFGTEVVLEEGESWMMLSREEVEVGYIHETRTRLEDGWLLEYDLFMQISLLGVQQILETQIKSTVDEDAVLKQFDATMKTESSDFDVSGHVEGNDIVMVFDLGTGTKRNRISLNEEPRLSNSALNQLIARDNLEPGETFEQQYFDPTVMSMSEMTFEFVRQHELNVFDRVVDTYHFRQMVSGSELDVYVDSNGEIWIQEFPLRIIGAKIPGKLGRGRALALRRRFEEESQKEDKDALGSDMSIETALNLLKGGRAGGDSSRFRITGMSEEMSLNLESNDQSVIEMEGGTAVVDTSENGEADELVEEQRERLLEFTPRVDGDADNIATLVEGIKEDATNVVRAESAARRVRKRLTVTGDIGVQSASAVLEKGTGDCTEHSLLLVAALRRLDIPARFVFGVRFEDGKPVPHQWVQYWDGGQRFVDIDPTTDTLLLRDSQLQLLVGSKPEDSRYVSALDTLTIERLAEEDSSSADSGDSGAGAPHLNLPGLGGSEDVDDDQETFDD